MAKKLRGSCHCGRVKFEVTAAPQTVTRCTCSICSKRGALWAYYSGKEFRMLTPMEIMANYRWRTMTVVNHFCPVCGCTTFTEAPDWSKTPPDFDHPRIGVNARLFDNFDLDAVPVTVIDGKNLW